MAILVCCLSDIPFADLFECKILSKILLLQDSNIGLLDHVIWDFHPLDVMTKVLYFPVLYFQFSSPWDAHRVKIHVDQPYHVQPLEFSNYKKWWTFVSTSYGRKSQTTWSRSPMFQSGSRRFYERISSHGRKSRTTWTSLMRPTNYWKTSQEAFFSYKPY